MPQQRQLEQIWTVLDIIRWGTDYFRSKGIESPRLTIELLLCHVLHVQRIRLYADFERPLTSEELSALRVLVQRRAHHEPLQYITGTGHFYGLEFKVTPDVLIPRPETELLVDAVCSWSTSAVPQPRHGLDIGTGSGCIPIASAHHLPWMAWTGLDVSEAALSVAHHNAVQHGLTERVTFQHQDVLSSLVESPAEVITMNPPYIPSAEVPDLDAEVRDYEPHRALTDDADGLSFYRRLHELVHIGSIRPRLIAVELGWQGAHDVEKMFSTLGPTKLLHDLQGIPRVLLTEPLAP